MVQDTHQALSAPSTWVLLACSAAHCPTRMLGIRKRESVVIRVRFVLQWGEFLPLPWCSISYVIGMSHSEWPHVNDSHLPPLVHGVYHGGSCSFL